MKRSFKIEFHNNEPDEKPIVTMSVRINNSGRLKKLDADGLKNLHINLCRFQDMVETFADEVAAKNKLLAP